MLRFLSCIAVLCMGSMVAYAQDDATPFSEMPLLNMADFQPTTPNWRIVGDARADRTETGNMTVEEGTGVLVNVQSENDKGHLFTNWSHGDLELDLEVMMPAGSNSGIYFQSRYEVQLFDSWGSKVPTQSDLGGIYQRWDESRPDGQKGYEGHPPKVNVARAPGLWQHLNIVFKAPRFDGEGKKISQAMFASVTLNGIVVQEEVPVTGPTRSAAIEDSEVSNAPLMIQGDHGPVAFRNVKYRMFDAAPVKLSNLSYNYYRGDFRNEMPAIDDLRLVRSEKTTDISVEKADTTKLFALLFEGNLEVPRTGLYTFEVAYSALFNLAVDGNDILGNKNGRDVSKLGDFQRRVVQQRLTKGNHDFTLSYAKGRWHNVPTALGWYISGPQLLRTALTAPGSVPGNAFSAYELVVNTEPVIQRNFVVHKDEKRTHAISVGFSDGLRYAYDMASGALLHLWKGSFVDTSTMWYQRGNLQSAIPLGSTATMAGNPAVYIGSTGQWESEDYTFVSYRLNGEGEPAFNYKIGNIAVMDEIKPDPERKYLTRNITLTGDPHGELVWCVLAESDEIEELSNGRFAIDGQRMYVEVDEDLGVKIESDSGNMRLIAPLTFVDKQASISYNFVW